MSKNNLNQSLSHSSQSGYLLILQSKKKLKEKKMSDDMDRRAHTHKVNKNLK